MRLAVFMWPKQPMTTSGRRASDRRDRNLPRRHRDPPHGAAEAELAHPLLREPRVDDDPGRGLDDPHRERKVGCSVLPQRLEEAVDDAVCEQPSDHARLELHRVQVAARVAARDGHPCHEVVQDDVVEDDDARPLAERLDDPAVRVRIVADVVERDIEAARGTPMLRNLDLDPLLERGQQVRAVVGDPGPIGRQR